MKDPGFLSGDKLCASAVKNFQNPSTYATLQQKLGAAFFNMRPE
jgi:hypothetical protein